MAEPIQVIRCSDRSANRWAGGVTSEIAIYPPTARYQRRDFAWRLSTATVEADASEFTLLPGFQRILLVTSGEMTLHHSHHDSVRLLPLAQDKFDGGWSTRSVGRATDFNLMCANACTGDVRVIVVGDEGYDEEIGPSPVCYTCTRDRPEAAQSLAWTVWYCLDAAVQISVRHKDGAGGVSSDPLRAPTFVIDVQPGDALLLHRHLLASRLAVHMLGAAHAGESGQDQTHVVRCDITAVAT